MQRTLTGLFLAAVVAMPLLAQQPPPAKPKEPDGVVEKALSWLGIKYRFGGTSSERGFDCAGLVKKVFGSNGIALPRTAALQFREGVAVAFEELKPGDLVFFRNTYKKGISHVGIYLGEKLFIHAGSRQHRVVVERIDLPYYLSRFAGGRRIARTQPPAAVTAKASAQE